MKIKIISKRQDNGVWYVTYRYWKDGDCACTAIKITKAFAYEPSNTDLTNAISDKNVMSKTM